MAPYYLEKMPIHSKRGGFARTWLENSKDDFNTLNDMGCQNGFTMKY